MSDVKTSGTFDTSFWIKAHRARLLPHVLARYELRFAPEVGRELEAQFPSGREFWDRVLDGTLTEAAPAAIHVTDFGPGERAAMSLAIEHPAWTLLLDDVRPFREAASRGLSVVCTPVLAIALFREGAMDASETLTALARLAALQTVSPHLITAALAHLGALLKREEGGDAGEA
jgi:predicted nucleic acid-binding protein